MEKRIVVALALYTRLGDMAPNVGRGVAARNRLPLPTIALAAMATLVPVTIEIWTVGAVWVAVGLATVMESTVSCVLGEETENRENTENTENTERN